MDDDAPTRRTPLLPFAPRLDPGTGGVEGASERRDHVLVTGRHERNVAAYVIALADWKLARDARIKATPVLTRTPDQRKQ